MHNADLSIDLRVALPVARHSAEAAWRLPHSATDTHNPLTKLTAAESQFTTGLFSELGIFFFFCKGKHCRE